MKIYFRNIINIFVGSICLQLFAACQTDKKSIYGAWSPDDALTFKLRIDKGIPWHSRKNYSRNKTFIFSQDNKYQLKNKLTGEILDKGIFSIYKQDGNEVYIRFFPEDNRLNVNNLTLEELKTGFVSLPGDRVTFLSGFHLLENNLAESFSLVLVSKNKIVKKYDNIVWKKH